MTERRHIDIPTGAYRVLGVAVPAGRVLRMTASVEGSDGDPIGTDYLPGEVCSEAEYIDLVHACIPRALAHRGIVRLKLRYKGSEDTISDRRYAFGEDDDDDDDFSFSLGGVLGELEEALPLLRKFGGEIARGAIGLAERGGEAWERGTQRARAARAAAGAAEGGE